MSAKVLRQEALAAKLAALPGKVKEELRTALSKSAEDIVALARSLVPVDQGTLRDSIGWTFGRAPRGSIAIADARLGELSVTVFAGNQEAFYARWVEFGTQKMRGQPYFFVSYRASRKRAKSRVTRAINKAAKEVARGVA